MVPNAMEAAVTPAAARLAAMVLAVLGKAIGGLAFGWCGTGFVRVWQNRTKDLRKRARRLPKKIAQGVRARQTRRSLLGSAPWETGKRSSPEPSSACSRRA